MDYIKLYNRLIISRKINPHSDFSVTEKHHIIPRSLGGDDSKSNLVSLTPKEHFIAHLLLVKIFQRRKGREYHKMLCAFNLMKSTRLPVTGKFSSRLYQRIREDFIKERKQNSKGSSNQNFGKKWFYNPISKECRPFYPDEAPCGFVPGRVFKDRGSRKKMQKLRVPVKNCKNCGDPLNLQKASKQQLCKDCRKLAKSANLGKLAKPKISDERVTQIYEEFLKFRENCGNRKVGVFNFAERYKGEISLDTLYKRWRKLNLNYK